MLLFMGATDGKVILYTKNEGRKTITKCKEGKLKRK
jgi:hypothetical protein